MTEAELIYQASEYLNRIWSMQQWWASISIGVLIMAHIASARLNLLLIIICLGLYTSYTLYMLQMSGENYDTIFALATDLQTLIESGEAKTHAAIEMADIRSTSPVMYYITFGGTYLSVVAYVLYAFWRSRAAEA
ncbi:MAG: hypothetical protein R3228_18700 [Halioglobus sp.]|nr:hypothetical protein [Halioglobus sp.]